MSKDSIPDLLVVSDSKYLKDVPIDAEGKLQIDWPEKKGFKESSIKPVNRNDMLPNEWDRVGPMGGSNFTTIPENGVPYTYSQRAIPYIENPSARHVGTFNNDTYYDAIDATYGLKGTAATWTNKAGEKLLEGEAKQYLTPLSGKTLEELGLLIEK